MNLALNNPVLQNLKAVKLDIFTLPQNTLFFDTIKSGIGVESRLETTEIEIHPRFRSSMSTSDLDLNLDLDLVTGSYVSVNLGLESSLSV